MSQNNPALRRQLTLLLASSLCATASLPAVAAENGGVEVNGGTEANITATANPLPSNTGSTADASLFDKPAVDVAGNTVGQLAANEAALPADPSQIPAASLVAANSKSASAKVEKIETAADSAAKKVLATPSENFGVNLVRCLVQRHVLTEDDAAGLIKQAQAETELARSQTAAAQAAADAGVAAQESAAKAAAVAQAAMAQAGPVSEPASDDISVNYIPETVKAQMREQIKDEVMAEAREQNWVSPTGLPDWVTHFRLIGDLRFRYEGDFYPAGNAVGAGSPFWNYNAINTGSPYDFTGISNPPIVNADQDRNRMRVRARFGAEVDLGDNFTAGFRIGTGETNSPVTENQTFGATYQGQGGNFSKYAIWLDRAFLRYEAGDPGKDFSATIGRFDNPFFATSMIWADDLAFDGAVIKGRYTVHDGVTPFLTLGGFPVYNTDFNFSSIQATKFKSEDKWLFGGQLGTDWKINKDFNLKVASAIYWFNDIEGKVSSPFTPLTAQDQGNTDDSRPGYAQRGNTYIALRHILPDVTNNFGATNQWQYFGLATPFHELALTGKLEYNHFEPFQISLTGEFVKNLAFDANAIEQNGPVNLQGPVNNNNPNGGGFGGGDTAWIVNLKFGNAVLQKRWDWQAGVNYRYVESDAVVDGFCDADFGLGGTNLKGYTVYGSLALSPRVWLGARWMSSNSIAGPPYKLDIIQIDLNAKF